MEKFNLEKYIANPSRKVVTRNGRNVIMTRDDLIDKEVAEKLSKEVVSYIIEQVTKNERN